MEFRKQGEDRSGLGLRTPSAWWHLPGVPTEQDLQAVVD